MKCLKPGMITEAGQRLRGPDLEAWMGEIGAWYDKHGSSREARRRQAPARLAG